MIVRISTLLAVLAVALPATAAATSSKDTLTVHPQTSRTYVRMVGSYHIAWSADTRTLCDGDTTDPLCASVADDETVVTYTFSRGGKVLYRESFEETVGTFDRRVPFRVLKAESGPKCVAGRYAWSVLLHDAEGRPGWDVARRGHLTLKCENGALVSA